jgi:urease beta subunit
MEKRSQTRFYDRGSVVCSHFNHGHDCDAQMLNFSRRGMCIRTDRFFKPGTAVLIRIDDCPKGDAVRHEKGGMRTVTLAKVLWSRHDEKTPEQRYTSGLRYF